MQALLSEVRQLRWSVETTLSLGPRMQLLLAAGAVHEQKVSRLSKQLDEVRRQIAAETARETAANDRLTSTVRMPVVRSVQAECRSIMLHNAVVCGALPRGAPFHFAAAAEATLFALVVHSIREDAAQADRKFDAWLMSPVGLP